MLTIYSNVNQLPKIDENKTTIVSRFRNPKKEYIVIIEKNLFSVPESVPESYKTIIENALQNAAREILRNFVKEFSYVPSEVSENLFSIENILDVANNAVSENLSKEEFETLWKESETRKHYISSDKYKNNGQYRKIFARFEELILKLQGTKSKFEETELDTILVKIKEEDLDTEFGQYVAKRVQYFKHKPAKQPETLDLLWFSDLEGKKVRQTNFAESLSEFEHIALNAKHTVILDYDGVRRYYPCENAFDAVVLMHALCKTYPEVELWEGDKLTQKYKAFWIDILRI